MGRDVDSYTGGGEIVSESEKAARERAKQKEQERLSNIRGYYEDLGLLYFIKQGDEFLFKAEDLEATKEVVEGFFSSISANEEDKKQVIMSLLNSSILRNKIQATVKFNSSLQNILMRMLHEKLSDAERIKIYKAIIYISSIKEENSEPINGEKISFTKLLGGITCVNVYKAIRKDRSMSWIDKISYDILMYRVRNKVEAIDSKKKQNNGRGRKDSRGCGVNSKDKDEICAYYKKLGLSDFIEVDGELIYQLDDLDMARRIVEEGFAAPINDNEKNAVLVCILASPLIKQNNQVELKSLCDLVRKITNTGLDARRVYSLIIKLSVYGEMLGYTYDQVIDRPDDLAEKGKAFLRNMGELTDVSDLLNKAVTKAKSKIEEMSVLKYYKELGLYSFIKDKCGKFIYSESNLYAAYQITEGFLAGKECTCKEKTGILRTLLNHEEIKFKGNKSFKMLAEAIGVMREKNLKGVNIYGFLINLSFDYRKAGVLYSYKRLFGEGEEFKTLRNIRISDNQGEVSKETLSVMERCQGSRKVRKVTPGDVVQAGLPALAESCKGNALLPPTSRELKNK